jgi:hypothetical protein
VVGADEKLLKYSNSKLWLETKLVLLKVANIKCKVHIDIMVLRVLSGYDIKYLVLVLKSWFSRMGNGVMDKGSLIVEGTLRLNY